MLYNGLTDVIAGGSIVPSLAESYEISQDQKTYVFNIRKDAKWSDGHKITAYDFEKSWKKTIDPTFPSLCPQLFYPIKNAEKAAKGLVSLDEVGINALDENTLVVHLNNPTPYFLSLTSFVIYFPIPSHVEEINPDWEQTNPVCSGPYKLQKWNHNNEIILEKNPLYWNEKEAKLDKIHISIVSSENTTLQMYENNEIDWIGAALSPIPLDSIPYARKSKEHTLTPIGGTHFCTFNIEKFPFTNKNIRKALGLAIDRKAIVKNITQADELVATRCIPPLLMHNKNFKLYEDNDIEKAKVHLEKGLSELGIKKEDLNITFLYVSDLLHKKTAEALKENWNKALDINVKLENVEDAVMMERLQKNQFQSALFLWVIQYNDSMNIFDRFKYKSHCKNYPSWENQKYNELLDYSATLINPLEREQILEKAEEIFIEDMPLAPIYHKNYLMLTKPHVKGVFVDSVGDVRFDKVYFSK